jgi:hypothetical protein
MFVLDQFISHSALRLTALVIDPCDVPTNILGLGNRYRTDSLFLENRELHTACIFPQLTKVAVHKIAFCIMFDRKSKAPQSLEKVIPVIMSVPVTRILLRLRHDLRQPTISPEKVVLETSQTSV